MVKGLGPPFERAVFGFTYLPHHGSGMLIAAIISGFLMGLSPAKLVTEYGRTIKVCAISLITISAMLAIGTLTLTPMICRAWTPRSASLSPRLAGCTI